jgi:hypothetical protein
MENDREIPPNIKNGTTNLQPKEMNLQCGETFACPCSPQLY